MINPNQERTVIENCDALIWGTFPGQENDGSLKTGMTFLKHPVEGVKPTAVGFKYNILQFRCILEVEEFSAIIGDPAGYVERIGGLGYHGIMYKAGLKPRKGIKGIFTSVLEAYGFTAAQIKKLVKEITK